MSVFPNTVTMESYFSILGWENNDYHTVMTELLPDLILRCKQYNYMKALLLSIWYFCRSWQAYEEFECMVLNILNKNPQMILNSIFEVFSVFILNIEAWSLSIGSVKENYYAP